MSKKILVIDDEPDILSFLSQLLRDEGYDIVTARDGVEGLKKLRENQVDLITLDLQMPNDTGTDFYRNMHHDKKFRDIPVIVISGIAGRHLAIRRPLAVFDKPIDKAELLKTISGAIG